MLKIELCIVAALLLCAAWGGWSTFNYFCGVPDDNIIEEAAEDYLESKTGMDFDFTPASKE